MTHHACSLFSLICVWGIGAVAVCVGVYVVYCVCVFVCECVGEVCLCVYYVYAHVVYVCVLLGDVHAHFQMWRLHADVRYLL